jgi:hypothetical protein
MSSILTYYRVHPYGELCAQYNGILSAAKETEDTIRADATVDKYTRTFSAVISAITV